MQSSYKPPDNVELAASRRGNEFAESVVAAQEAKRSNQYSRANRKLNASFDEGAFRRKEAYRGQEASKNANH